MIIRIVAQPHLLKINAELCPPKPIELLNAWRMDALREALAT